MKSGLDLLSKSGFSGVTLGVLANDAGMSKSGLFAHFRSKEAVQLSLLDETAKVAQHYVILPAMQEPEGFPRLKALVTNWFGWTERAGLPGGCPVAAAVFELDDAHGDVRDKVARMEAEWRNLLAGLAHQAVEHEHFRPDLDVDQFVWELCGLYLSHHVSLRFIRDRRANERAQTGLEDLFNRSKTHEKEKII